MKALELQRFFRCARLLWAGLYSWATRAVRRLFESRINRYIAGAKNSRSKTPLWDRTGETCPTIGRARSVFRFLRHRLVLEDGSKLRLLEVCHMNLNGGWLCPEADTDSLWSRDFALEPVDAKSTRVLFSRGTPGTKLDSVQLPAILANRN